MLQAKLSSGMPHTGPHAEPSQGGVWDSAPLPTLAQVFGLDIYSRAVELLSAYGFKAEVRAIRLSADIEERTVAVYVQRGDERLDWHGQGVTAVPLAFRFRSESRAQGEISLFSGYTVPEVTAFIAALTTVDGRRTYLCPDPLNEWDPHSIRAGEEAYLKSHLDMVDELGRMGRPTRRNQTSL